MLATPLTPTDIARGEITWALLRGADLLGRLHRGHGRMGLVQSWWMLLALPATLLIGFGFAGAGMALTTFMRTWQDFEYIELAITPMFLFSGTFFPRHAYPPVMQRSCELTPLYQGVVLCRELTLGTPGSECIVAVVYLVTMGLVGKYVAGRRIATLLLK